MNKQIPFFLIFFSFFGGGVKQVWVYFCHLQLRECWPLSSGAPSHRDVPAAGTPLHVTLVGLDTFSSLCLNALLSLMVNLLLFADVFPNTSHPPASVPRLLRSLAYTLPYPSSGPTMDYLLMCLLLYSTP